MPRIDARRPIVPAAPKIVNPPAVKAETKKALKAAFDSASKAGQLEFHAGGMPLGQRFVRVPLKAGKGADQYSYTALIPVGALAPGVKPSDPNKVKSFFIERSGGFAGITMVAGPVTMGAKGKVSVEPFFSRFLEGQNGGAGAVTKKAPSDHEEGGGAVTMKAPSDNEDGGGGGAVTKKAPSDHEEGGGGVGGGGGAVTMKAPSDNEDGGGGGPIRTTRKAPSDHEDGGTGGVGGGGGMQTMKYPSDNEDGGGGRTGGGGRVTTMKAPSDNDE